MNFFIKAVMVTLILNATSLVTAEPTEEYLLTVLEAASRAKQDGYDATAVELLEQGVVLIASDPQYKGFRGAFGSSDLRIEIAEAMARGKFGDPCAQLTQSRALLDQARAFGRTKDKKVELEMLADMEARIGKAIFRLGCAATAKGIDAGKPDAGLAGHYYLSGVMETGSELLLKSDGQFDWFMSYGSVDQFAKGRWGSDGKIVTLVPDRAAPDAPLFRTDERASWSSFAEGRLVRLAHKQRVSDIEAKCPFLASGQYITTVSTPAAMNGTVDPAAPARAEQSLITAKAARAEIERLAPLSIALGDDQMARIEAARSALGDWHAARADMRDAYDKAKQQAPDLAEPVFPKQCEIPDEPQALEIPEGEWQRGIAVIVGDPVREMRFSGISVNFEYSDGHSETRVTDNGGWAIVPLRPGAAVSKVALSMTDPVIRSQTLTFAPLAQGIQTVTIDVQQIVGQPFEALHLTIDGEGLVPIEFGPGRYEK